LFQQKNIFVCLKFIVGLGYYFHSNFILIGQLNLISTIIFFFFLLFR